MNDLPSEVLETQKSGQCRFYAEQWLTDFEDALVSSDAERIGDCFHEDCHWRDVLAFTWQFASAAGRDHVATKLKSAQERTRAHSFIVPSGHRAPREVTRLGIASIEAIFAFETVDGACTGLVRLAPDKAGFMRAWLVSTTLQSLRGHEEKLGANRPSGAAYSRNFGGDNWADMRRKAVAFADREPAVLVVGGAQAGLSIAARLNQLGVDTLVVERWSRIGDSWRRRYHSLALHNSTHINHLPYMEFPPTWPLYIPKDMLANWFEFYADAMEINCWTGTEFIAGAWDEAKGRWAATLRLEDGSLRIMHPRHLVFANGVSSYPMVPDLPGLDAFTGAVMHAEEFDTGFAWTGKRALVLGTGSSANDIALDLHSNGAETTLIQRGSTTVVSIDPSARLNESVWDEGGPLEDSDLIVASAPPAKDDKMAVNVDEAILKACNLKFASTDAAPKFDFDSESLSEPEKQVLEQIAKCLTTGPLKGRAVDLVGRADPRGETEYNMTLGAKRARAAHTYLSGLGVGGDKLFDTSRGEIDATGKDEAGWTKDRRVDVKLRGN